MPISRRQYRKKMVKTGKNNIINYFIHLFEYNNWATTKAAESVIAQIPKEGRPAELLSHIISSQKIWLGRIINRSIIADPWEKVSPEKYINQSKELTFEWINFLESVEENDLDTKIDYKNTKGEMFTNTIKDILTHVINHSTYHRAQIAQLVRQSGGEPAKTDYIVYQRRF